MKKLSNKILLIGLLALVAIFVASRFFRSPGLESNLRRDLLSVDTASIDEIRILPAKQRTEEIKLTRKDHTWKVSKGSRMEATNRFSIEGMLGYLANMQAQRMVSRKKEKWEEFNVGEKGTHVSVYQNNKEIADFHVGKLGFTQTNGGNFTGGYTYVRLSDENEVYTVEGFLESSFNNEFNDWRDKTFLKVKRDDITRISFRYPADSSFVLEKRDSIWWVGNNKADVPKVESLLNYFSSKYLTEFVDGFVLPGPAEIIVEVEGTSGKLATVEAWKGNEDWVLSSSAQKGIYFSSKNSNVITDILVGKKKLLPNSK